MPAQCEETISVEDFGKWLIKHIDVWFAFTRSLGLGISRMEDIVFVTGRHLARSSASVAFPESQVGEQVSFGVSTDISGVNVMWHFSREDIRGVSFNPGPSGQVRLFTVPCIPCSIWPNSSRMVSGFASESVHIRQRFPCHQIFEHGTEASSGSGPSSGFWWTRT